jgi:hypothetical protein
MRQSFRQPAPGGCRIVSRRTRPSSRTVEPLERRTLLAAAGPAAAIDAPDVSTAGGVTQEITVTYTDPDGVDIATIGPEDLLVTGPGGRALTDLAAQITPSQNAPTIVVRYTIGAPGGVFNAADDGRYTVTLPAGAVSDVDGNPGGAATATFEVNAVPSDVPMTAVIGAPDLTVAGATTHTISVHFQSPFGVDPATVDATDLVVTGPGGAPVAVTAAAVVPPDGPGAGAESFVANYTLAAPGGLFDPADNGVYTVALLGQAVTDAHGNPFTPTMGTFIVNVPPDTTPPAATVLSFNAVPGAGTATAIVNYADDIGVETASIDASDITVSGPSGPLAVSAATLTPGAQPGGANAQYTIDAPGGAWDGADAGRYTVTVNAGAVADVQGNAVAAAAAPFDVPLPPEAHGPDLTIGLVPATGVTGSVLPGAPGRVRVRVTNAGDRPASGRLRVQLLARGTALSAGEIEAELATTEPLPAALAPGHSRLVSVRFKYPQRTGSYQLVARADPDNAVPELNEANNVAQSSHSFAASAPFADIKPMSLGAAGRRVLRVGRRTVVLVTVRNEGTATFAGDVNVDLFAAAPPAPSQGFQFVRLTGGQATKHLVIHPHKSHVVRLRVLFDQSLPPGRYRLKANVNPTPTSASDPQDFRNAVFGEVLVVGP